MEHGETAYLYSASWGIIPASPDDRRTPGPHSLVGHVTDPKADQVSRAAVQPVPSTTSRFQAGW